MNKILFLGQKSFGEKCFKYLINNKFENIQLSAIVSDISKNNWWGSNEIFLNKKNFTFLDNNFRNTEKINEIISLKKINTIVSVQHPWILDKSTLEKVNYNAYNFHNAKLPEYKGNKVCSHVILNGESHHYSTLHFIAEKVDMGQIIFEKSCSVEVQETSETLFRKGEIMGFELFKKFISYLESDKIFPRKTIKEKGTFYKLDSLEELKEINDINDIDEVDKKSRAFCFNGFEPSYFFLNGEKFYVYPNSKKY